MPTVLKKDGFRIYPNDHLPAHVHVFKAGREAKNKLYWAKMDALSLFQ